MATIYTEVEIETEDVMCELSEKELINEWLERNGLSGNIGNISLIAMQNIESVITKMDKIDQFELETFLNKY